MVIKLQITHTFPLLPCTLSSFTVDRFPWRLSVSIYLVSLELNLQLNVKLNATKSTIQCIIQC